MILQYTILYTYIMVAGINTAWEMLATGAGVALLLYAIYTVYNLARHGLNWLKKQAG